MRRFMLLGAAVALTGPLMLGPASAAGTAAPQMKWAQSAASNGAIVEKAGYHRCRKWRRKCTRRWNWGTKRYARCMWRHRC